MKKKIAFITLSFEGGGAEKILTRLLINLHSEMKIVVITFYHKGRYLDDILALPGLEYHCIHAENGNTISFAIRIHKIISQTRPDKILSFLYYPNIVTYLSLIGLKTPFIPSERSNHRLYLTNSFKHRVWKWLLKKVYIKAASIITISYESKTAIETDFNIPKHKISVIYNGLSFPLLDKLKTESITDFIFEKNIHYLVAVGSFSTAKNYPMLIESFLLLHKKHNDTRLLILGKGDSEREILQVIERYNLGEAVHLLGYRTNPYKYLSHASCYVLSSKWEGFPNALLEAMYINGHVISTRCPTGPSEIITHKEDGMLCETNNSSGFADAMEKMCFDEDFRVLVFENSRKKIAKFDEKIMVGKYKELLGK
jgi:N-acetylgalactosamine-N,N'-diacetylbacillosaminyl-diphospho-undecaprenol 4-alpha-N-acetylgalactosaminyltransferase